MTVHIKQLNNRKDACKGLDLWAESHSVYEKFIVRCNVTVEIGNLL